MKTSELKRILREDCAEVFSEDEHSIYGGDSGDSGDSGFWMVWKKEQRLVVRGPIPVGVLTALGKYHTTPLKEREDEKRYIIMNDNNFFTDIEFLTLRLNNNTYYFSMLDTNEEKYQSIFTQKEIDDFPAEIKGAIECGFLKKVEIEE